MEEINKYYAKLIDAVKSTEPCYFYNRNRKHNAAIQAAMFEQSDNIRMFCGSMSIFRKGFKDKIDKNSQQIVDTMFSNMKSFFYKENSVLEIILEKYDDTIMDDLEDKQQFESWIKKGKIKLYRIGDDIKFIEKLPHFSIATPCFVRSEQDKEAHTALCVINNKEMMDNFVSCYEAIKQMSVLLK